MKLLASKTGQSSRKISISRYTEWKKAKATGRLIILEELESEPSRNDAGLAAAELALAVEKHELDSRSMDTVGAVGNSFFSIVIPKEEVLCIEDLSIRSDKDGGWSDKADTQSHRYWRDKADIFNRLVKGNTLGDEDSHCATDSAQDNDTRDIDEKQRNSVIDKIHKSAVSISSRCGIKLLEFRIVNQDPPALSNELIINTAESASQVLKLSYKKMISRAYHDSLFMARVSLPWA